MSISVKDIIGLKSTEAFVLIAGIKGLGNRVASAKILNGGLDFECKNKFVLAELTNEKSEQGVIIKKLIENGASGLAFRTENRNDVSQDIIEVAEKNSFPIFSFGEETSLENVIYQIMSRTMTDDYLSVTENTIEKMIETKLSTNEVIGITGSISTLLLKNAMVVYIKSIKEDTFLDVDKFIVTFNANEDMKDKAGLRRYKNGLMIMITKDNKEKRKYLITLDEIMSLCGIEEKKVVMSISNIHQTYEEINICFRESYYAYIVARADNLNKVFYEDIGVYKFLIPNAKSETQRNFMNEYLKFVLDNEELLETVIEFVRTGGNLQQTADRIFCHKNTVRYRINKLHEAVEPNGSSDMTFYENISAAVKIYLINQL
ncbi:MAG: hypothetical protein GX078_08800 [Clostridiales bacterium]|nr:hypothetical protein [Clostridiales bacterium]